MKAVKWTLLVLHLLTGMGAFFGGLAAVINPVDPLGMPLEALKNSPFTSYLIPGIILLAVIGIGNLLSAWMMRYKSRYQGYISSVAGWALVIWIVVQCIMLNAIAPPHALFFVIGMIQAGLSALLLLEQRLFPANIAINLFNKIFHRKAA